MRVKKSLINIGKNPYTIIQFNYTPPKDKAIVATRIHFIQILDRSGSMAQHIDELIENVKETIHVMKPTDLLSIIWFSGPGQCKVLLRGATAMESGIKKQLDKLKSTIGTTCFSEAMMEAKDIVEDLADLCDNFIVSLFTDGEPVVPWSAKEEELRSKNILAQFSEKTLSFNTIGYGGYYNSNFLKELAAVSRFGRHAHSTKIEEYLPIFTHNFKSVENTLMETVEVKCVGKSILYLSRKNSRLLSDHLKTNVLSRTFNKFYIISPCHEEFQFEINEEIFESLKINGELTAKDIENLFYALAYEEYYKGNSTEALDILTISMKDKYLIKSTINSFTAKERQKCIDTLLRAAHNRKIRLEKRVWKKVRLMEGQLAEHEMMDDLPCFIELLNVFEKNGDKFIPVSTEKYRRIGKKVVDHYNAFKSDSSVKIVTDFKNLVFTKEKLNISIRYEITGFVTVNPRQAKAVGLKTNIFKAKIYREQTIIKDGDINIEKFQALVSKSTLEYLGALSRKDLFTLVEKNDFTYPDYTLIEMDISKLPVLNRGYVSKMDNLDSILDTCYEQRVAECRQKVIKYFIEKQYTPLKFVDQQYSKEQIELLESYGLDSSGVYNGIDNKPIKEVTDQYECKFFEFSIKGFSTLPKVEDLLTKINENKKKLNGPETIMANYIKDLKENEQSLSVEQLNKRLQEQKSIIKINTRILAQIKLAKALTGGWWTGLKLDSKENYLYEKGTRTLVIKTVRKIIEI